LYQDGFCFLFVKDGVFQQDVERVFSGDFAPFLWAFIDADARPAIPEKLAGLNTNLFIMFTSPPRRGLWKPLTKYTHCAVIIMNTCSNELKILQCLHSIKSRDNYTIPLLGRLKLNVGTFIFLPEATPLDLGFALGMFRSKVVDFSRQLIKGVAFLHRHGIAHLDIKPRNVVVILNHLPNELFIIDFDISVRVGGPSALIDRWCGTPGWMTPEIGHQDGRRCSYSPIRADLWSCGLMLRYLASKGGVKEENPFEALTRQLLNKNPRLRPLLNQWSSVTVGHSPSGLQGRLKRKPDAFPHGAKRLASTVQTRTNCPCNFKSKN
jgi:hypothetical protein